MSLKHLINDEIFFLPLNLDKVLRNSTPGEFVYIWQSKRDGTIAMTIENANSFLSDVLPAVAVLAS